MLKRHLLIDRWNTTAIERDNFFCIFFFQQRDFIDGKKYLLKNVSLKLGDTNVLMTLLTKRKIEVQPSKLVTVTETEKTIVRRVFLWNEIPTWQQDNEHILDGYVRETNSFIKCFESLFYIHNETVNIYSHLIPGLIFFAILFLNKYYVKHYTTTSFSDYVFIDLFFFGVFTCLTLSSTFHCLKSHSLKVATFGNKLDYLGIVVLIVTSMLSILSFGFYDNLALFYTFSSITVILGTCCGVMSLKDKFRTRNWRPYRALMFVIFGLSAVLPIFTGFLYFGLQETMTRVQLKWIILEGFFYIFGAFLYAIRFPERLNPGMFDNWGHSHQIFHIMVVIASLCHLQGLLKSYRFVQQRLGGIEI